MNTRRIVIFAAIVAAVAAAAVGCTRTVVYKEREPRPVVVVNEDHGPPPHAPANGYRYKNRKDDVTLVYDSDVDVYVVSGYKDCWYSAGQYFRLVSGTWEVSVSVEGGWKAVTHSSDIPPGLRNRGNGHGHGKGHKKNK